MKTLGDYMQEASEPVELHPVAEHSPTASTLRAIFWLVERILKTGWIVLCTCVSCSCGLVWMHYEMVKIMSVEIWRAWR